LKKIGACFDTLHDRILVNDFKTHSVRPARSKDSECFFNSLITRVNGSC
jgi:hypothetical protein